jgi:hypothetical protein
MIKKNEKSQDEKTSYPPLRNQSDAVRYFIQTMDIDMLYHILDEKMTFQDFPRNEFLLKLERVIGDFKANGDTFLNAIEGRCGQCSKDKSGFLFVGNNSKMFMNLLFDLSSGEVKDLYECSNFKTNFDRQNFTKRLWIDDLGDLPF